jgi:hypothetical protein
MNSAGPDFPIARAILALFMFLIAMLGWMLAASALLANAFAENGPQHDLAVVWFSIPLGGGYLMLGWTILRRRGWSIWLAWLLFCGVLATGFADLERPGSMMLDSTLTLLLAAVSSLGAIIVLSIPGLSRLARRESHHDGRQGKG